MDNQKFIELAKKVVVDCFNGHKKKKNNRRRSADARRCLCRMAL